MMNLTVLYSFLVALCFSLWPILTRFAKIPTIWTAILINAGTLLVALVFLAFKSGAEAPSSKMIWIGLIAGVINGSGFLAYSYLLSNSNVSASTVVAIIDVLIPIAAIIFGLLLLKEGISLYKIMGIFLGIVSIYLILKK